MAVGIKQKENVNKIVNKVKKKKGSSHSLSVSVLFLAELCLKFFQFLLSEFVVMLFHYDGNVDSWKDFEWSSTAIHVSAVNQTKWYLLFFLP